MAEPKQILIADDEETFLESTGDLLAQEGYECDCASDAVSAAEMLRKADYDLLIADIRMPGNSELEFIQEVPRLVQGLPVILVTGYPSVETAIQSIQLPVMAYLIKPFDFSDLLPQVRNSIERYRLFRALQGMQQRLQDWQHDLSNDGHLMAMSPKEDSFPTVNTFATLILHNIVGCLSDLKPLTEALADRRSGQHPRRLSFSPPRTTETMDIVEENLSAREIQMQKTLGRIANDLEELGIVTGGPAPSIGPGILKDLHGLSRREWEVLRQLRANYRVGTIARSLHISPHTVRNHLKSIFRKVGARSQEELLELLGRET